MKRKLIVVLGFALTALLAGCAPITARGKEHQAAIEKVLAEAKTIGLGTGDVVKDCAVPFDCSANDQFHSTIMLANADLTDSGVCEKLILLGKSLGFGKWRRDYHDVEESNLDQSNFNDGLKACIESIGVNSGTGDAGQSEGFIVYGDLRVGGDAKVPVNLQLNSLNKPDWSKDSARGYYFSVQTLEG